MGVCDGVVVVAAAVDDRGGRTELIRILVGG